MSAPYTNFIICRGTLRILLRIDDIAFEPITNNYLNMKQKLRTKNMNIVYCICIVM